MKLYNTQSRSIEEIEPLNPPKVTFYSCGPTVYDYSHIGHGRKYTSDDLLKRALSFLGYDVEHIMNVTDVGHLVSDEDEGEDKLEKGARKAGKTPEEIAAFFTDIFKKANLALNIIPPTHLVNATDHINDMIALIKQLEEKGATYETDSALYFDTTAFENYGALSGQSLSEKQTSREDVKTDPQKKHPADFALWFKRVGHHANHTMHWDSPWGDGFPGWHIECSAMSMKYLGETIDIHSGGIDLIPVHHENEIAQSECATGQEFVKYWFHTEFLKVDGTKMSKSRGNVYSVEDVIKKGFDPLSLRYLYLQTHYRQEFNFTWDALRGAETALRKLRRTVIQLRSQTQRQSLSEEKLKKVNDYSKRFTQAIENDLQIPQALAVVWEVVKSNIPSEDKLDLILSFDQVFGLGLAEYEESRDDIPQDIRALAESREKARSEGDFKAADALRNEIIDAGYIIKDEKGGYRIKKA